MLSATSERWSPGTVLLDTYRVLGILGEGGMGRVYRVRHLGWDMDLALKTPLRETLGRRGGREEFDREAERWIGLGLHPHVTTAYYVRALEGLPRIFAEVVEGGSLAAALAAGRRFAPADLLGLGIEIARGLEHAHRAGAVHADLKPANVLLTPEGVAKVTDFGLGTTPVYCSPEQAQGLPPEPADDVWCWGVTLLEVMLGERTWAAGAAAPLVLDSVEAGDLPARVAMSPAFHRLLREALEARRDRRPSPRRLAERLEVAFRSEVGRPYPALPPAPTTRSPDDASNRAVALIDLGRTEEALQLLERTLAESPGHAPATFNRGLQRWRQGELDDLALLGSVSGALDTHPEGPDRLASLHRERGAPGGGAEDPADRATRLRSRATWNPDPSRPERPSRLAADGGLLAVVLERSRRLAILEARTLTEQGMFALPEEPRGLALRAQAGEAVVVFQDGRADALDLATGQWTPRMPALPGGGGPFTIPLTAAGAPPLLARMHLDGTVDVLRANQPARLAVPRADQARGLAYDPIHRVWATAGKAIRLWDAQTGAVLRTIDTSDPVVLLAFDAAGTHLRVATLEGVVASLDATSGAPDWLAFCGSPDRLAAELVASDRWVAVLDLRGTLHLYDARTGQCHLSVGAGALSIAGAIRSVAFGPEGDLITADEHQLHSWVLPRAAARAAYWVVRPPTSEVVARAPQQLQGALAAAREALAAEDAPAACRADQQIQELILPGLRQSPEVASFERALGRVTWRGPFRAAFRVARARLPSPALYLEIGIDDGQLVALDRTGARCLAAEGRFREGPPGPVCPAGTTCLDACGADQIAGTEDGELIYFRGQSVIWRRRDRTGERSLAGDAVPLSTPLPLPPGSPMPWCGVYLTATTVWAMGADLVWRRLRARDGALLEQASADTGGGGISGVLGAAALREAMSARAQRGRLARSPLGQGFTLLLEQSVRAAGPEGRPLRTLQVPEEPTAAAWGASGLVAGLGAGRLVFATPDGAVRSRPLAARPITALAASPVSSWVAYGTEDGSVGLFDLAEQTTLAVLRAGSSRIRAMALDPAEETLGVADDAGEVHWIHLSYAPRLERPTDRIKRVGALERAWRESHPRAPFPAPDWHRYLARAGWKQSPYDLQDPHQDVGADAAGLRRRLDELSALASSAAGQGVSLPPELDAQAAELHHALRGPAPRFPLLARFGPHKVYRIEELLRGSHEIGLFRGSGPEGPCLISATLQPLPTPVVEAASTELSLEGLAPLLWQGSETHPQGDLQVLVERRPPGDALFRELAPPRALAVARAVARTAVEAQGRGQVLGGIRPELIFADADGGRVMVAPRFPAWFTRRAGPPEANGVFRRRFLPADARDREPLPPDDVFALAASLAYWLGTFPFGEGNLAEQLVAMARDAAVIQGVPPRLGELLGSALRREPGARPSMREFEQGLGRLG